MMDEPLIFPGGRRSSKQVSISIPGEDELQDPEGGSSDPEDENEITVVESSDSISEHVKAAEILSEGDGGPVTSEERVLLGESQSEDEEERGQAKKKPRVIPPPLRKLQHLQSALDLDHLAKNEQELKANLYFHISNPLKRWKVEKRLPIKLLLQVLKTLCLIVQLALFTGTIPYQRAEFFYDSREVFENLFLINFEPQEEDGPARPTYCAYTSTDILNELEYLATRYYELQYITVGGYDFLLDENGTISPIELKLRQYKDVVFNASGNSFLLDGTVSTVSFEFVPPSVQNIREQYFNNSNDTTFHRFIDLLVTIPIKNIRIVHPERAECFLFMVEIFFQSDGQSGKIYYNLKESHVKQTCNGTVLTPKNNLVLQKALLTCLDVIVITLCSISLFLTATTTHRAIKLGRAMGTFYEKQLRVPLSWWERRSLFSLWHVFNVVSDILIISGTVVKIALDYDGIVDAAPTRILLGTALLFQAGVILRYVSYFNQLNTLTRTLALAFPELLKFLLCAFILFIAFAICGWTVLGSFHPKFNNLNSAVEALFGLLNGDDIYATFIQISPADQWATFIYSRVFLYVFLSLFIYAVLNLFTTLVIAAYEISQNLDTATQNEVRKFVFSGPLTPQGVALKNVTLTRKYVNPDLVKGQQKSVKREKNADSD